MASHLIEATKSPSASQPPPSALLLLFLLPASSPAPARSLLPAPSLLIPHLLLQFTPLQWALLLPQEQAALLHQEQAPRLPREQAPRLPQEQGALLHQGQAIVRFHLLPPQLKALLLPLLLFHYLPQCLPKQMLLSPLPMNGLHLGSTKAWYIMLYYIFWYLNIYKYIYIYIYILLLLLFYFGGIYAWGWSL